jgi:hypothetical protein
MVAGFELPEGDPDAIDAAVRQLSGVVNDLHAQETTVQGGFGQALASWKAPRADDFRHASAGVQVQLKMAQSTVESSLTLLSAYGKALRQARTDIADLGRQADRRQLETEQRAASMDPNDVDIDREWQHCAQFVGTLAAHAADIRNHLRTLAEQTAAAIEAATETALPGASALSPDDVRRRVDHAYGVEGTASALARGTLTAGQAWAALDTPGKALAPDEVKHDGQPDWPEILRAANDQAVTAWAIGSTPPAGWALGQLVQNFVAYRAAVAKLPTSLVDVVGPELDSGRLYGGVDDILGEVERTVQWTAADSDAASASFNLWRATETAGEGGLPAGFWSGAAHTFSLLGAVSDVATIWNPDVENSTEGNVLRGAAAANLAGIGAVEFGGTAAAALGLDAAVGWVPVAGQVVVVATGLFLAGDWVYHNWDTVKQWGSDVGNFVTDTVPDALGDAASDTVDALGDAADAVGDFLGL